MNTAVPLQELCRRLKAADREAFELLFRQFREDLLRFVYAIVNNSTVAHDLVQDVFVSLWGGRAGLDPSQSLRAYLYRVARNRAYRYLRDERSHAEKHALIQQQATSVPAQPKAPDVWLDADVLTHRLGLWIEDLPARQREALLLSRYHGLSHREAAAVMGVSPRTVNNHVMRALEHLQARIQAFEPTLLES